VNSPPIEVRSFTAVVRTFLYKLRTFSCPASQDQTPTHFHDAHCDDTIYCLYADHNTHLTYQHSHTRQAPCHP
jgi:hypothetical protein